MYIIILGSGVAPGQGRKPVHDLVRIIKRRIHFLVGGDNMSLEMIVSLIQQIGFPIACVIAMFYYWNKEREDHKQELASVTEALNNNTLVLQSIRDHLIDHD